MWWWAGAFAILQIITVIIFNVTALAEAGQGVASFAIALVIGFSADELRRNAITRQGYRFEGVVLEQNTDRATQRFLDAHPELAIRMAARS
jgi:hypothetical protein